MKKKRNCNKTQGRSLVCHTDSFHLPFFLFK